MNTQSKTIVLSSASKARQELLQRLQLPFVTYAADVDETPFPEETAKELVQRLACAKAKAAATQFPNALIIGADEVGWLDKTIMGKPLTHDKAVRQLLFCSKRCVTFFTGLTLYNSSTQRLQTSVETYQVYFRSLNQQTIERYLELDKPYNCAGSIKAEGMAITLIERFSGDDPNTLIGLPLIKLIHFLNNEGVSIL